MKSITKEDKHLIRMMIRGRRELEMERLKIQDALEKVTAKIKGLSKLGIARKLEGEYGQSTVSKYCKYIEDNGNELT